MKFAGSIPLVDTPIFAELLAESQAGRELPKPRKRSFWRWFR